MKPADLILKSTRIFTSVPGQDEPLDGAVAVAAANDKAHLSEDPG